MSQALGERDRESVVQEYVAVYEPGKRWAEVPREAAYSGVPVVRAIDGTKETIEKQLKVATR